MVASNAYEELIFGMKSAAIAAVQRSLQIAVIAVVIVVVVVLGFAIFAFVPGVKLLIDA